MALEDDYRAYRSVIAAGIRVLRPHVKAEPIGIDDLADEIERFNPQLVVCTCPNTVNPGGITAWVDLSLHHNRATRACIGGRYLEYTAPLEIEGLLEIIDDAERFIRTHSDLGGC